MKETAAVLLSCFFFLLITVESSFFPENQEVTYKYTATVKTLTNKPTKFESVYHLSADLRTVNYVTSIKAVFENVTFRQYLGQNFLGEHEEMIVFEIPKELKQPFVIEYDDIGKSVALLIKSSDVPWSINIKKALAYIFQADLTPVNRSHFGYHVDELSVYGSCPVFYTTYPSPSISNEFTLRKHITPTKCDGLKLKTTFNISPDHNCETPHENPLTMTLDRQYEVSKLDDGKFLFDSIKSVGAVTLAAFGGESDTYVMKTDQHMMLHKIKDVPKEKILNLGGLTYIKLKSFKATDEFESLYDMIGGRAIYDSKMIINTIIDGIKSIIERLDGDGKITIPGSSPTVEYVMQQLRLLNKTELSDCYDLLKVRTGKESNIFLQLLPAVGTYSSVLLIRDMVTTKSVNDDVEEMLVSKFPFHLKKSPDMALLEELSVLKRNGTSSGVLAFATVLSKALDKNPEDPALNILVDEYIDDFKSLKSPDDRRLYLSALNNIKSKKVSTLLLRVVKNDKTVQNLTSHQRSLAIWILSKHHYTPYDMKLYWSILENLDDPLVVRSAALGVLLTKPSSEDLLRLYNYITTYFEETLYTLFFSRLENLANMKAPCFKKVTERAKTLLQVIEKPDTTKTIVFDSIIDYFNTKFKFGLVMRNSIIGNIFKDNFTTIMLEFSPQISGFSINEKTILIHLSFQDFIHFDSLKLRDKSPFFGELFRLFIYGSLKIDIIGLNNDKVVFATDNYRSYLETISFSNEFYGTGIKVDGEMIFPTDFGVLAKFFVQTPTTFKQKYKFIYSFGEELELSYHNNFFGMNHQTYGMKVYNPILDVWHGIRRNHIWKTVLPLNITSSWTYLDQLSFLSLNHTESCDGNIKDFEFETSAYSEVFRESVLNDTLDRLIVTEGERYQQNEVLWEHDCEVSNTKYQLSVRQCERSLAGTKMNELKQFFLGDDSEYLKKNPIPILIQTTRHIWAYATSSPTPGMCIMSFTAKPKYPHVSLKILTFDSAKPFLVSCDTTGIGGQKNLWTYEMSYGDSDYPKRQINSTLKIGEYKYCCEAEYNWTNQKVEIKHLIFGGKVKSNACPKDQMTIEITEVAKYNDEENKLSDFHDLTFENCRKQAGLDLMCVAEQTHMGQFSFDIKTNKLTPRVKQYWASFVGFLTRMSPEYKIKVVDSPREKNKIKVSIDYKGATESDIIVESPLDTKYFRRTSINYDVLNFFFGRGENDIVSKNHLPPKLNFITRVDSCLVTEGYVKNIYNEVIENALSTEWQRVFNASGHAVSKDPGVFEILVKYVAVNDGIAVLVKNSDVPYVLEISPKFETSLNGVLIEESKFGYYYDTPGLAYKITERHLFMNIQGISTYLILSKNELEIHVSDSLRLSGICAKSDKYWY